MNTARILMLITVATFVLWGAIARHSAAQTAQTDGPFTAQDFDYGSRFRLPEGQQAEIWNPAKRKLVAGGPMIGGTVRAVDPRTYCAMANAGYDFIWVEMQHEAISWEQVARLWRTCPGPAAPGDASRMPTSVKSNTPRIWGPPSSSCRPSTRSRRPGRRSTGPTSHPSDDGVRVGLRVPARSGTVYPEATAGPGTTMSC